MMLIDIVIVFLLFFSVVVLFVIVQRLGIICLLFCVVSDMNIE